MKRFNLLHFFSFEQNNHCSSRQIWTEEHMSTDSFGGINFRKFWKYFFRVAFSTRFAWVQKRFWEDYIVEKSTKENVFTLTKVSRLIISKLSFTCSEKSLRGNFQKCDFLEILWVFSDSERWIFHWCFHFLNTKSNASFQFLFGIVFSTEFWWFREKLFQQVLTKLISTVRVNRLLGEQCFGKRRYFKVFLIFDPKLFHLTISKRYKPFHSTDFQNFFHYN